MKLSLIFLFALLTLSTATAKDRYEKGEVVRQSMGTSGKDKSEAMAQLTDGCLSLPFIEAGLAELTGLDDVTFTKMENDFFVWGTCLVTINETITRSN